VSLSRVVVALTFANANIAFMELIKHQRQKLSKMILLRRIDSTKMVVFAEAAYQSADRQDFPVLEMILWN
jgi:hypothetical protein